MTEPEELYAQIRKEKTEEALSTGYCWIITADSIPRGKLSWEEVVMVSSRVQEEKPSRIPAIRFLNFLTGTEKTMEEVLQEVNL